MIKRISILILMWSSTATASPSGEYQRCTEMALTFINQCLNEHRYDYKERKHRCWQQAQARDQACFEQIKTQYPSRQQEAEKIKAQLKAQKEYELQKKNGGDTQ